MTEIEKLQAEIDSIQDKKDLLVREGRFEEACDLRDREKRLLEDLYNLKEKSE